MSIIPKQALLLFRKKKLSMYVTLAVLVLLVLVLPLTIFLTKQQQETRQYAAGTTPQPVGVSGNWNLVFDDEFNGTSLDTTKWVALDNWTLNGIRTYASNVSVSGGNLILTLASQSSGAYVATDPNSGASPGFLFPVGDYIEYRTYFPGNGTTIYNWPGVWTSGPNWPAAGESDIAEGLGTLTSNYHSPAGANNSGTIPGIWSNAFHTYGMYRAADHADVYWDGNLIRSYPTSDNGQAQSVLADVTSGNTAVYGTGSQVLIDYVRVWAPCTTNCTTPTPTLPPVPQSTWRIDAGSTSSYTDSKGNVWQADMGITGGTLADHSTSTITNTSDSRIFQTEHYGMSSASYSVPNGNYTVNLDFTEDYWNSTGSRIFNVAINGTSVLSNFDVYAAAGGKDIALVKSFPVTVTNGQINLAFTASVDNPEINGIEIIPQVTVTPTPTNVPTPMSTATPTPSPTNTPIPTATYTPVPLPTNTPTPTSTPVPTPTSTPLPSPTPIPPDTTPPTITITSPLNGALVRHNSTITITASASDNVGVIKVEFVVNGTLICADTTTPYNCNWSVPGKPGVTYTITGRAYDAMGNAASNSIQVRSTQ